MDMVFQEKQSTAVARTPNDAEARSPCEPVYLSPVSFFSKLKMKSVLSSFFSHLPIPRAQCDAPDPAATPLFLQRDLQTSLY